MESVIKQPQPTKTEKGKVPLSIQKEYPFSKSDAQTRSQEMKKSNTAHGQSGLDDLAVELKLNLLHTLPDLATLRSLVHASPRYHAVYLTDRCKVLQSALLNELDPQSWHCILPLGRALDVEHGQPNIDQEVTRFVEMVKKDNGIEIGSTELQNATQKHGTEIARIHQSILFAINDYCTSVFSKNPMTGEPLKDDNPLSPTEKARIVRAFYRFQILWSVFEDESDIENRKIKGVRLLDLITPLFPAAWEKEEIMCIREYMVKRYRGLYQDYSIKSSTPTIIYWKEQPDSSVSHQRVMTDDQMIEKHARRCAAKGFPFLQMMLQAPPAQQIALLRQNTKEWISPLEWGFVKVPGDRMWQTFRYRDWINSPDLVFEVEDLAKPNAGWLWSTGYLIENMWGEKPDLIEWGYVFWDKERLDRWGILGMDNSKYVRTDFPR